MRLHVRYLDTAKEADIVTVSASARHLWEQENGPLLDSMRSGSSAWADFLAHTTLRRSGRTELDLLDWLDAVEAIAWEMPEDRLVALAETLGVVATGEFEVVAKEAADPTGPRAGAHTPDAS